MSNAASMPTSGKLERPHMPYMDGILADLASGEKEEVDVLWQRHLHWGYWADPTTADGSVEDYAAASERLAQLHFDVANIKDGMRVVDCGCGVGGAIDSMNERFSDVELVGLNIDERQLEVARGRVHAKPGNSIEFVQGNACELPFEDESFDAVTAVECIMHFPSRGQFLREAARVLRPGGRQANTDIVPPLDALPVVLPTFALLMPRVMGFYGRTNKVPAPGIAYRRMARKAGLVQRASIDITKESLPTFDVLARYFGTIDRAGDTDSRWMEKSFRYHTMDYRLLSFEKRA